jgi:hypothetical protein
VGRFRVLSAHGLDWCETVWIIGQLSSLSRSEGYDLLAEDERFIVLIEYASCDEFVWKGLSLDVMRQSYDRYRDGFGEYPPLGFRGGPVLRGE